MKATIDDVARLAGVSVSTVSRVLNDERYVREAMRERVHAAVKELHYRPNLYARNLAGDRSHIMAMIFDHAGGDYVAGLLGGAVTACSREGLHLVIEILDQPSMTDKLASFIGQINPDGIILTSPVCNDEAVIALLQKRRIPMIRVAPIRRMEQILSVGIDDQTAGRDVGDYLIGLGHRRIGHIIGHPEHGGSHDRLLGFQESLKAHGVALPADALAQGYFDFASGARGARALLDRGDPPTAIFASNDEMAAGVLSVAAERGLKVPDDLSVMGFDDGTIASWVTPSLSTIRQSTRDMAALSIANLMAVREGRLKSDAMHITVRHEMIIRQSTAPPRQP
ncbi:HTH-type transcriptional regulator DegA [alpha proteobacterium Q-1]|nr:LacI family DNA-binding transcriptional regulator [Iodidimonas nitroreducens]GAK33522.1 HTH-type transcriptional regulator DegA [alpha proteobacterium Q-1]